jgi:carotenoid 1,2-hydratase
MTDSIPRFDHKVPADGYHWWYLDGSSEDGAHALTVIAFVGSVFSPYYAAARRRGSTDPGDYCAINVALYGKGGKRWAMTERDAGATRREFRHFAAGPSVMRWTGDFLEIEVDEVTVPLPSRLRGRIRVYPLAQGPAAIALDPAGRHFWQPLFPRARIELDFERPRLCWQGNGYLDSNRGSEPLESGFRGWHWSRAPLSDNRCAVLYDTTLVSGETRSMSLLINGEGDASPLEAPALSRLPPTRVWRIARETRSEPGAQPIVHHTAEDTPFYARSLLRTRLAGEDVTAFHESLSLERFASRWVQCLLPFRMPRRRSPTPQD